MRVDGIDSGTGQQRPRQLGTYPSQRSATNAARSFNADDTNNERGTVSWLVRRYVAGRTDITLKSQEQYEWAIPHIENGLGAIQLAMLDRDDVAIWINNLANGGKLSRRGVQICRNVLRASLSEAVDEGLITRSPAGRVGLPRTVAKELKPKEAVAWNDDEVTRFLAATRTHRWAIAFRLGVLYGLRRSEILALRWDDLDVDANTLRIDESLVATRTGAAWSNAKNERSRRTIPLDDETMREFARRRALQAKDRLQAGDAWEDVDLVITTKFGRLVLPRSLDRNLERIVQMTELPRLTSHGLRHTAATHMVQGASDLGELRAIADLLGHSPEMLMNTYAHALPKSQSAVVDRIAQRSAAPTPARRKSSARVVRLTKPLTEVVDGQRRIVEHRPQIVRIDDLAEAEGPQGVAEFYDAYAQSLPPHHRYLLHRHSIVDIARKVVGVGSVGTRCMILLLESDDGHPLLMQFKEAGASVLEPFCEPSPFAEHGERVVQGQRLMQATGDIFLGWARLHPGGVARDFYFRQLWDGKGSVDPATMRPNGLSMYIALCGRTLALAHARTRNVESIAGYLGDDTTFDEAVEAFAAGYADIVERDFDSHAAAIASGGIHAVPGV